MNVKAWNLKSFDPQKKTELACEYVDREGTSQPLFKNKEHYSIALVGHPNAGKTTLFNLLSGQNANTANVPGATVAACTAVFPLTEHTTIELVDLPGLYSLVLPTTRGMQDEAATQHALFTKPFDLIINVIDVLSLRRGLYLHLQLRALQLPVVIFLTHVEGNEHLYALEDLKQWLQCPIVEVRRHLKGEMHHGLTLAMQHHFVNDHLGFEFLSPSIFQQLEKAAAYFEPPTHLSKEGCALLASEGDLAILKYNTEPSSWQTALQAMQEERQEGMDIDCAIQRYQWLDKHLPVMESSHKSSITQKLDHLFLHPLLGVPCFALVMYILFFLAVQVGRVFQDSVTILANGVLVDGLRYLLSGWHMPTSVITVLVEGVGQGVATTLSFIPILASMFFFFGILEESGYMARAAFVIDRLMHVLGLSGRSFIPLVLGFGCNVPAVMGTRTLAQQQERILTVLMSPFMSCGARLAIYAAFVTVFFKQHSHSVIFALYFTGIVMAVLTALIFKRFLLTEYTPELLLSLPRYHLPKWRQLLRQTRIRVLGFVKRSGTVIVPLCFMLSVLNIPLENGKSILETLALWCVPLFSPMGITLNNWPAFVGLVTGLFAKEAVLGTLNTLYAPTQMIQSVDAWSFIEIVQNAYTALFSDLLGAFRTFWSPTIELNVSNDIQDLRNGLMVHFSSGASAFAYLIFILLYAPCVSTIAAMIREVGKGYAIVSMGWTSVLAYAGAVIVYQLSLLKAFPVEAISMMCLMVLLLSVSLYCARVLIRREQRRHLKIPLTLAPL